MKYSDIKGKLIACSTYRYTRCVGLGTTVDGRSEKHVYLDHYQYNENTRITQSFKPFMTLFMENMKFITNIVKIFHYAKVLSHSW